MRLRILLIFITGFVFYHQSQAYQGTGQSTGFDLVMMKNGDYHHGTVAHETFVLKTEYGTVAIPYLMMAELHIGTQSTPDRIITHLGDHFSGQLEGGEVVILRNLQPMLPLHTDDIAEIKFNQHQLRKRKHIATDVVELRNGDRFMADIELNDLLMKSDTGIHHIVLEDIHVLDFASLMDQGEIKTQVTLNDGQIIQGELMTVKQFVIQTRYGQQVTVPVDMLVTLAYKVNYQNDRADYNYRRHITPASLLQDRMVDGTLGPELIVLRGGRYIKGDLQGDGDTDEKPTVSNKPKAFAVGIYETTFEEYDRFCDDTRRSKPDDSGWGRGLRPAINVSWDDAVAYTQWLSRKTRQTYRLPSDSEWEYMARAGTTSRYWWGNEIDKAKANCEGCGSLWDGEKTAPVGRFLPNAFGIHDTAGNVFEWVADCLQSSFADAPVNASIVDKSGCGKRVIRGGAWSFPAKEIRSANRWRDFPTRKSDDTGFRVVRELN
ncbi:MAG: formylglycine-generating enzyme family protein [Gammaproteobacteria bacterium]|nr:formylglycine-generating enzyme family protein [Gammaproteobacteria bacterium]